MNNIRLLDKYRQNERNFNLLFFDDRNKFLHHEFAEYLKSRYNIIMLEGRLHIYQNGIYRADSKLIKSEMVRLLPFLRESQRREVLYQLQLIAKEKTHADPRYICVKNGIFDVYENRFISHNPHIVITNMINATYNPNAVCKEIDDFLITISSGDKEIIQLLKEMIGYTLFRRNIFGKAFILLGSGGNGKSTLINLIGALLGTENVSSLSLSELGDRFKTGLLANKLANLGDDIPYKAIQNTDVFKKLTTGDGVMGEFKGETPFFFRSYAKLIFSSNKLPQIFDNSTGLKDRLVIVPLKARVRESVKEDLFIEDKITTKEALSYLLNIGLDALRGLLQKQKFISPLIVKREMDKFEVNNNPVREWLHELRSEGLDIHNMPVASAYNNYVEFCKINGYKSHLSKNKLTTELKSNGYISTRIYKNGKQVRAYQKRAEHDKTP